MPGTEIYNLRFARLGIGNFNSDCPIVELLSGIPETRPNSIAYGTPDHVWIVKVLAKFFEQSAPLFSILASLRKFQGIFSGENSP